MFNRLCINLLALLLVTALGLTSCAPEKAEEKERVGTVLKGLTMDENSSEYMAAICQWYTGKNSIRADDLEVAQDHLLKWLKVKSLKHPLTNVSVKALVLSDGAKGKEAVVTVLIDGHELRIKAVEGETLEWADQ